MTEALAVAETSEDTNEATTEATTGNEPVIAAPKQNVVSATNPTEAEMLVLCEDMRERLKTNDTYFVVAKPTEFNFKKSKDKVTGIETVRESVQLAIPYPSLEGLVAIISNQGKGLELIQEAMENVINAAAREIIAEDYTLNAANFPIDKVSWEAIANQPKAQRRGGGIPKETWEGFTADYVAIMPAATGKKVEQVATAAKLLATKLASAKTNEPVLRLIVSQLAIYADNSPQIEEFQDCVAFLLDKADKFLNASDEDLLGNL